MNVFGFGRVEYASVSAIIRRADGREEDLGVIADSTRKTAVWTGPVPRAETYRQTFLRLLLGILGIAAIASWMGASRGETLAFVAMATVIVNGGQAIVTNLVSGIGGTVPKFVAWGTGAGTAAVTDTTLFTETTDEARTSGTVSRVTTTVANDTYQVVGQIIVVTANKTITNTGLFDASTSGNLYFKSDFTGLALNIGDSITFTDKIKFS